MVAINWATFISGPLRLPSAEASADASPARLGSPPISRLPRIARRDAADIGADPRIARGAGGEAVFFAVGHEFGAVMQ